MDIDHLVALLKESAYWIAAFGAFLAFAVARGKRGIITLILGLYFALLISVEFPYYGAFEHALGANPTTKALAMIAVFLFFTIASTYLFTRLIPRDYDEKGFGGFWKKIVFAGLASVLVMAYSYHALPVTDLITPGSPIQALFAPEQNFFWWLLVPLIGLLLL